MELAEILSGQPELAASSLKPNIIGSTSIEYHGLGEQEMENIMNSLRDSEAP